MSEFKIQITQKELREAVEWHLSGFKKDVSHPNHDVRDYESLDINDFDEFSEAVFKDLQDLNHKHNRG